MACLEILEGFHRGTQGPLPDEALLGRHRESWLCLPEARVSRQHARILRRDTTFVIEDLHSSHGVLVQGQRLVPHLPHTPHHGDEICIGPPPLVFLVDASPPPRAHQDRTSRYGRAEPVTQCLTRSDDGGTLQVHMRVDETAQPTVALALDASANMLEVSDAEQHTAQGLREAVKRLQALCQVSTALGTITDRETLLHRILDCLFDLFPVAERAFIMVRDNDSSTLMPVAAKVRHGITGRREEVAISRTIVQEVTLHKRSIVSCDALDDTRFHEQASIIDLSIRSIMCAAPRGRGDLGPHPG